MVSFRWFDKRRRMECRSAKHTRPSAVAQIFNLLYPDFQSARPSLRPSLSRLSQRDCVLQPRVARHELPWVWRRRTILTPTGLHPERHGDDTTPLG